jgi:CubicO group peptidase (beta-lactamase class C family)
MTVVTRPASLSPVLEAALERVDQVADRTFARWRTPGLVYGIVLNRELIHTRGLGTLRVGEDATPTPSSVFRIASMTKSFTAATVLLLRDEGRLRLDDEIAGYVPELASVRLPTADSPQITIRHLLTMTAGLPRDDPWGDRQQGLDLSRFSELLRGGLSFAWAPGTRFEYSNLGYGILGRLITNVAGHEYREVVRERLLQPLGMTSSGYLADEVEPARLARGYAWRDGAFSEQPMDGYGALASMGGMFSTVEDLQRWVAGFQDAFPPRDDADANHPLSRASRREMQQPMSPQDLWLGASSTDAMPDVESLHYGFGLFVIDDVRQGRVVAHAGGYPGFGSDMRWHLGSGFGVITLANGRYTPTALLARELLASVLLPADVAPVRRTQPNEATQAARAAVDRLIAEWDDALAAELFAMNVELDEPMTSRRAVLERIRERHGTLTVDADVPGHSLTGLHQVWWLRGERGGRVRVEILLSPEASPKVQTFAITSVPEPPQALQHAAREIVELLNSPGSVGASEWPGDLAIGPNVDFEAVRRQLRAAQARFAPVELGAPIEGDGEGMATYRLHGPRGHLDLALTYDAEAECIGSVSIAPVRLEPPDFD